jgi:hypothetical protein
MTELFLDKPKIVSRCLIEIGGVSMTEGMNGMVLGNYPGFLCNRLKHSPNPKPGHLLTSFRMKQILTATDAIIKIFQYQTLEFTVKSNYSILSSFAIPDN